MEWLHVKFMIESLIFLSIRCLDPGFCAGQPVEVEAGVSKSCFRVWLKEADEFGFHSARSSFYTFR